MNILHCDDALIVIDKPAGLPVLRDGWEPDSPCLHKILEQEFGRLWVVHRLDKSTSGVMLFARTAAAHRDLNIQFDLRQVKKVYHAIVDGVPDWDEKACRMPLKVNVGHKHRTIVDHKRGIPAETLFKTLKRARGQALVEAHPITGRTHQIRVHLYALGFPLLGDHLYGDSGTRYINRPALHAFSITFSHPILANKITFTAHHPQDFVSALGLLGL